MHMFLSSNQLHVYIFQEKNVSVKLKSVPSLNAVWLSLRGQKQLISYHVISMFQKVTHTHTHARTHLRTNKNKSALFYCMKLMFNYLLFR